MSKDPFKVSDPYRTNPLSVEEGGVTVIVQYIDGKVLEYDKIKYPWKYMASLKHNPKIKTSWIKGGKATI